MNQNRDILLWKKIKADDPKAFEALYHHYADDLIVFGRSITSSNELIQEALQKLFTTIWDTRKNATVPQHVKAYLIKSFRNHLIREIKLEQRLQTIPIEDLLKEIEGIQMDRDLDTLDIQRLKAAIEELTPRQKEIINLRYYQGIKHQEIAEILNINYQSVVNLLARTLQQLRKITSKKA